MKPKLNNEHGNAEPSRTVMFGRCRDQRVGLNCEPVIPPRAPSFLNSQEEDMIRHSLETRRGRIKSLPITDVVFPVLRAVMANLVAADLVSVHPLDAPTGVVLAA